MRQAKSVCLALALCVLPAAVLSAGEIYRWKDANGTWHYADQPVPGAERISGMPSRRRRRDRPRSTSASGSTGRRTAGVARRRPPLHR
jgi:hypothetical protein